MGALLLLLSGCVPLPYSYVMLEDDELVLRDICGLPIREAAIYLVDDRNFVGAKKWEVKAYGEPARQVVLNVANPGYETVLDWDGPVPDRFVVGFATGTRPLMEDKMVIRSEMSEGLIDGEDKETFLQRRKWQLGCA